MSAAPLRVVHGNAEAPDAELVERVLGGDREAYSVLVRRHQEALYRYALRMGLDHDAACDLVQDAFVKGYASLAECRDRSRYRVWVFRILRNRCLDYLKNIRRRSVPLEKVPLESGDGPGRAAERSELRSALRSALDALPEDMRDAFLMKHYDGRSYEEMADIAGASVSAMKMRVHRAREALQERLREAGAYEAEESR